MNLEDKILEKIEKISDDYHESNMLTNLLLSMCTGISGVGFGAYEFYKASQQDNSYHYELWTSTGSLDEFIDGEGNQIKPFNQDPKWDGFKVGPEAIALANAVGGGILGFLIVYNAIRLKQAVNTKKTLREKLLNKKTLFWGSKLAAETCFYLAIAHYSGTMEPVDIKGTIEGDLYTGSVTAPSYLPGFVFAGIGAGVLGLSALLTWAAASRKMKKGPKYFDQLKIGAEQYVKKMEISHHSNIQEVKEEARRALLQIESTANDEQITRHENQAEKRYMEQYKKGVGRLFLARFNKLKKYKNEIVNVLENESERNIYISRWNIQANQFYKTYFKFVFEGLGKKEFYDPKIDEYITKLRLTYEQVYEGIKLAGGK